MNSISWTHLFQSTAWLLSIHLLTVLAHPKTKVIMIWACDNRVFSLASQAWIACHWKLNMRFWGIAVILSSFCLEMLIGIFAHDTRNFISSFYAVAHLAWKKRSVAEGYFWISLFSIKPHFLLRLEINGWILRWCQSIILAKFCRYRVCRQYLLIKAAVLLFCTECSETHVAASALVSYANSLYCSLWHAALRLHQVVCNIQTTPQSSQYIGLWRNVHSQVFAQ